MLILSVLYCVSAGDFDAKDTFAAASFVQVAGTGTTTFSAALSTSGALGIEIDATNVDFQNWLQPLAAEKLISILMELLLLVMSLLQMQ